jgi:HK97 family phage major capsid protein/HK97 family phage prohead protease
MEPKQKIDLEKLGTLNREFSITRQDVDKDKRTILLSFSSETPIDRWFGKEILDHGNGSVMLERLQGKAPLLVNHDPEDQIGVVESANISSDKRGYATVRFGKSPDAEEILVDVLDGIRTLVSFAYKVHEMVLEKESDEETIYRVTKWEPLEISIVSVPADISVGVGRELEKQNPVKINNRGVITMTEEEKKAQELAEKEAKKDVRDKEVGRTKEILAIGEQFNMKDEASKAVREDITVDAFRKTAMDKLVTKGHIDTQVSDIGMSHKEIQQYSLLRAIKAVLTGSWDGAGLEFEASRTVAKLTGREMHKMGFFVPHDVLKREVTKASGGTGLIATQSMPQNFIELLRNRAALSQLGAQILSGLVGNISIPKQSGAATAYWVTEGYASTITLSDSAYTALALSPKYVGARTPYTRAMLLQANPSIEMLVMNDLVNVLSLALDLAGINGAAVSNQPVGILNTPGIGSVDGTGFDWAAAVELETDVVAANGDIATMAYLTGAAVNGFLKTKEKASGYPQYLNTDGQMNGYPVAVCNQVPASTIIMGAFSQVIFALWGGLDILVDPYTRSDSGGVIINAYQAADVGIRHAASFSACVNVS